MELEDHPDRPLDPYPEGWRTITAFRYRSALSLVRPLGSLEARLGPDADYVLQHDFLCGFAVDGGDERLLVVPKGLITDLTSVPPVFRAFVGRVGPWLEAAIVHDYLYIAWQDVPGKGPRADDRRFADAMMLRAMEAARVAWLTRWVIYLAVRAFGGPAFRRHAPCRYVRLPEPELRPAFTLPPSQPPRMRQVVEPVA